MILHVELYQTILILLWQHFHVAENFGKFDESSIINQAKILLCLGWIYSQPFFNVAIRQTLTLPSIPAMQ